MKQNLNFLSKEVNCELVSLPSNGRNVSLQLSMRKQKWEIKLHTSGATESKSLLRMLFFKTLDKPYSI